MSVEGSRDSFCVSEDEELPLFVPPSPATMRRILRQDSDDEKTRKRNPIIVEDEPEMPVMEEKRRRLTQPSTTFVKTAYRRPSIPVPSQQEEEQPTQAMGDDDDYLPVVTVHQVAQPKISLRKRLRGLSLDVSNILKRVALDAREEARTRVQDVDQVSTMAKKLFLQYIVDTVDLVAEYNDPTDYPDAKLYDKSIRDILTSDL